MTSRRLLVAALAFLAFVPSLGGDFLDLDDTRFVRDNEALRHLEPIRCFADPSTQSTLGWEGTYRPLRTLDWSIDMALGGGSPLVFRLRSLAYHVLAALLVLALLSRLLGSGRAALAGALVYAVHPLGAESVAWITSRADVLLAVLLVGALVLHIDGRRPLALVLLALALFAKEAAVVFPALALLVDRMRGERHRWGWLGGYAGIVAAYVGVRSAVLGVEGHVGAWWGGGYGANVLTVARGIVHSAQLILFPVGQTVDHHVPATTGLDAGAVLGIVVVLVLGAIAWRAGRTARFAVGWAALAWLPTSNLLFTVGIPTAERFLYLPMVGIAAGAGALLARFRSEWAVLGCLLALALARSVAWTGDDTLYAAQEGLVTPRTLIRQAGRALDRAHAAAEAGDRAGVEQEAAELFRLAEAYRRFHPERMGIPADAFGGGQLAVKRANAYLLLERPGPALEAARQAVALGAGAAAHYNAFAALFRLGRAEAAQEALTRTLAALEGRPIGFEHELRVALAGDLNTWARALSARGLAVEARGIHEASWRALPDPVRNAEARRALDAAGDGR